MDLDRGRIDQFLRDLGKQSRGRISLLGGAALIHAGIRTGVTQDIDLRIVEGDLEQAILRVARVRGFAIEFVEPSAFIPLPSGYQYRSQYVGTYGRIGVEYFDFVTIAVSKILRSQARDVSDVTLLVQQGYIEESELDTAVREVASKIGSGNYTHLDGRVLLKRYQAIKSRF